MQRKENEMDKKTNEAIYLRLASLDRTYNSNMPQSVAMMFLTLFDDESYTWSGLGTLFKARFGEEVDELVYFLTHD